ncbi:MAG TPA: prepilin-type N-terminal cleavage/methylation domain-containing protein [Bryobacteraceae bacterium]|nr:prepilin-type N-terminal cleavage/methylation domain-containing protein [Bryobacteraceae bacterium]
MRTRRQGGFSLLEVLVATFIMAVAVAALLSNLTTSLRNASNLTDHDRAALLARHKMDELLLLPQLPQGQVVEGGFSPVETAGLEAQWRARATIFEFVPGSGPGAEILERVELQIVVHRNGKSKPFALEAFRRRFLRSDEPPPVPFAGQPL